jgi:hypothetical protein
MGSNKTNETNQTNSTKNHFNIGNFLHKSLTSLATRLWICEFSPFNMAVSMIRTICRISGSAMPLELTAGLPMRMPLVTSGLSGSPGILYFYIIAAL